MNHPQLLKSFADHFKDEMGPLLAQMEREAGSLVQLKGRDFYKDQPVIPSLDSERRLSFCKDLGLIGNAEKLSSREKECLKWHVKGKTAKETAQMLKLSSRTVEFYFENIKDKLGCFSKHELLKTARLLNDAGMLP